MEVSLDTYAKYNDSNIPMVTKRLYYQKAKKEYRSQRTTPEKVQLLKNKPLQTKDLTLPYLNLNSKEGASDSTQASQASTRYKKKPK